MCSIKIRLAYAALKGSEEAKLHLHTFIIIYTWVHLRTTAQNKLVYPYLLPVQTPPLLFSAKFTLVGSGRKREKSLLMYKMESWQLMTWFFYLLHLIWLLKKNNGRAIFERWEHFREEHCWSVRSRFDWRRKRRREKLSRQECCCFICSLFYVLHMQAGEKKVEEEKPGTEQLFFKKERACSANPADS